MFTIETDQSAPVPRTSPRLPRIMAMGGALVFTVALMLSFGMSGGAARADSLLQCDGIGDGGGQGIVCTVDVVNNLDNTDPTAPVTSSVMTITSCLGAANAAEAGSCTSSGPMTSPNLITIVDQCNYAVNGGGSTLICSVNILNNVTGTGTIAPVTVNECNNSLDTGDVLACDPYPSSTDPSTATVIECNDSANGGGSVLDCIVDSASVAVVELPVTVNQCNNSANGGGSTVICRVNLSASVAVVPPTVVEDTGGTGGTPGDTGGTPGDTGGSGGTPGTPAETGNLAETGFDPTMLLTTAALALLLGGAFSSRIVRGRFAAKL